jgi:hypothetical protein
VQEDDLKLGKKTKSGYLGNRIIRKEGLCTLKWVNNPGKIPRFRELL